MKKIIKLTIYLNIFLLVLCSVTAIKPTLYHNYAYMDTKISDDLTIQSTPLSFLCEDEVTSKINKTKIECPPSGENCETTYYIDTEFRGYYYSPNPRPKCWETDLYLRPYLQNVLTLGVGDIKELNEYITIKSLSNGKVYYGSVKKGGYRVFYYGSYLSQTDWSNIFEFDIHGDFLDSDIVASDNLFRLNDEGNVNIGINNKLGFSTLGGVSIKYTYLGKTFFNEKTVEQEFMLGKNWNAYEIPIDTSILGDVKLEITPYLKFLGSVVYLNKSYHYDYRVIYNIEDIDAPSVSCNANTDCPNNFQCEEGICNRIKPTTIEPITTPTDNTKLWVYGGIALLVILFIYFITQKR